MKHPTIIFDIDGTLADNKERLKHILRGEKHKDFTPKDWEEFHDGVHLDDPIASVLFVCRALILSPCGPPVIFITGRMEKTRVKTQAWLSLHLSHVPPSLFHDGQGDMRGKSLALYMRGDDDFRDPVITKEEVLDRILVETDLFPILAFEDNPKVSAMWRRRGIAVAHVGDWLVEEPKEKVA